MSNMQAKKLVIQGLNCLQNYEYSSGLKKLETARGLVEAGDTQLREEITKMIETAKSLVEIQAKKDAVDTERNRLNSILYNN